MKIYKCVLCVILACSLTLLTSCAGFRLLDLIPGYRDPYIGKRPTDFPQSVWVSQDPYIRFVVGSSENGADNYALGELTVDELTVAIEVQFEYYGSRMVIFYGEDHDIIIAGLCDFYDDRVVITVGADSVFGGKYKKLTLEKALNGDEN